MPLSRGPHLQCLYRPLANRTHMGIVHREAFTKTRDYAVLVRVSKSNRNAMQGYLVIRDTCFMQIVAGYGIHSMISGSKSG